MAEIGIVGKGQLQVGAIGSASSSVAAGMVGIVGTGVATPIHTAVCRSYSVLEFQGRAVGRHRLTDGDDQVLGAVIQKWVIQIENHPSGSGWHWHIHIRIHLRQSSHGHPRRGGAMNSV